MENYGKALITNVQGFSTEDGPGIRTTVFFKGCPLRCPWCHNPEGLLREEELVFYDVRCIDCKACLEVCEHGAPVPGGPGADKCVRCFKCVEVCPSTARQKMGKWVTVDQLLEQVLRDRVFYETSGGGVTASGGEAAVWAEFVAEFFKGLKAEGIHTALDTSGVVGGGKLEGILGHTDLLLVDLKIMDPGRHKEVIGVPLEPILEHIREMDEHGIPIIFRVPIIPGYTDDVTNLDAIAGFIAGIEHLERVELLAFHQLGEAKYRQLGKTYVLSDLASPSDDAMLEAKRVFEKAGLPVIIGGKE